MFLWIAPLLATPYALALAARLTDNTDELSLGRYQPENPIKNIFNIVGIQIITSLFCCLDKVARTTRSCVNR